MFFFYSSNNYRIEIRDSVMHIAMNSQTTPYLSTQLIPYVKFRAYWWNTYTCSHDIERNRSIPTPTKWHNTKYSYLWKVGFDKLHISDATPPMVYLRRVLLRYPHWFWSCMHSKSGLCIVCCRRRIVSITFCCSWEAILHPADYKRNTFQPYSRNILDRISFRCLTGSIVVSLMDCTTMRNKV